MMRVQVTLKSGAQIEFDTETLTSERNNFSGELTSLNWTKIDGKRKLHTLALSEVAAIVVLKS